jgi:hypothetical protein
MLFARGFSGILAMTHRPPRRIGKTTVFWESTAAHEDGPSSHWLMASLPKRSSEAASPRLSPSRDSC